MTTRERGVTAAVVLFAHVVIVWTIIQARLQINERDITAEPLMAMLIDQPRRLQPGVLPVEMKTQPLQLPRDIAPRIPDIAKEIPEPVVESAPVPAPEAAVPPLADNAAAGASHALSGPPGGGRVRSLVQRVLPRYPLQSARRGEQGAAVMQLRVDEAGRVVEVKVAHSTGSSRLDEAALDAVRKWKFAPATPGSAPQGTWGETELRFLLYRFTYSRLGEKAMEDVRQEQLRAGAVDEQTPGSDVALRRFIADVQSGAITGDPDADSRKEVEKLRVALDKWGAVKSLQFMGGVAQRSWVPYDIKPAFRAGHSNATVEVRWDMYEVRHQHDTSEWLIAVDRQGMIWSAQAGPTPVQ